MINKIAKMRRKGFRCGLIVMLALGPLPDVASAQEREDAAETVENVQLVFHLVEADGFTDDDPEISDVVSELRKLFNFQGYRLLSTSILHVGLARSNVGVVGSGSQRIIADDSETPLMLNAEVSAYRSTRNVRAKVTLTEWPPGSPSYEKRGEGGFVLMGLPGPLLEASVTIRDGQRVVLGSARRSAGEPVLILIVTPRIDPT